MTTIAVGAIILIGKLPFTFHGQLSFPILTAKELDHDSLSPLALSRTLEMIRGSIQGYQVRCSVSPLVIWTANYEV